MASRLDGDRTAKERPGAGGPGRRDRATASPPWRPAKWPGATAWGQLGEGGHRRVAPCPPPRAQGRTGWQQRARTPSGRTGASSRPGRGPETLPAFCPSPEERRRAHRMSVAACHLSPGAAPPGATSEGSRAPSPRPSLPENRHDSGKCAHTGLALELVASVPCPPPHAPSPPQGPASRKGPTAHVGARAPQALSSWSQWSWDTAWGIPGPSPGTAHSTSALQTQGSSHSALDTRSSPPWNALTTQAQA